MLRAMLVTFMFLAAPFVAVSSATASVKPCTIVGTPGKDVLVGTMGSDVICGGQGNDIIWGRGGGDYLRGGYGDDRLHGERGADWIRGGFDIDALAGERGNDHLNSRDGFYLESIGGGYGYDVCVVNEGDSVTCEREIVFPFR